MKHVCSFSYLDRLGTDGRADELPTAARLHKVLLLRNPALLITYAVEIDVDLHHITGFADLRNEKFLLEISPPRLNRFLQFTECP